MRATLRSSIFVGIISFLGLVCAEGGSAPVPAPAAAKRDAVSVRLPSAAFAALETIDPEHIR